MECSLFVWQHSCISIVNTWLFCSCLLLLGHQNMTSKYWNALHENTSWIIALFLLLDLCEADIASIKSGQDWMCLLSLPCHVRRYRSCGILITFYVMSPVLCLMPLLVIFNQQLFHNNFFGALWWQHAQSLDFDRWQAMWQVLDWRPAWEGCTSLTDQWVSGHCFNLTLWKK